MKKVKYTLATLMVALVVAVVLVGCKKEKEEALEQTIILDERASLQIAKIHNEFLSQIVKEFDYSKLDKSDSYEELHRCMRNLPCDQGIIDSIINNFYENHYDIMDATSYYNMWKTTLDSSILMSNYSNKSELMSYIQQTRSFLLSDELNYNNLLNSISDVVRSAEVQLTYDEMQIFLAYVDVLENSAYFWFPTEFGGSGEGSVLFNGKGKVPGWVGQGVLADAESAAFAFGFGWWAMGNPAGLIAAGVGSLAASAYQSLKTARQPEQRSL